MKIYTKTGDNGTTGLVGGSRVSKTDLRIVAVGDVDELNATLGVAIAVGPYPQLGEVLLWAQARLFDLGAELATPNLEKFDHRFINDEDVVFLEGWIDEMEAELPPLANFILPGGGVASAHLHLTRCVARRAERSVIALAAEVEIRDVAIRFLNRLSDMLFVAARTVNRREGVEDIKWQGRGQ